MELWILYDPSKFEPILVNRLISFEYCHTVLINPHREFEPSSRALQVRNGSGHAYMHEHAVQVEHPLQTHVRTFG
jgi:hypothetical protein